MRVTMRDLAGMGADITTSSPELLTLWLREQLERLRPVAPNNELRLEIWPHSTTDANGAVTPDWPPAPGLTGTHLLTMKEIERLAAFLGELVDQRHH